MVLLKQIVHPASLHLDAQREVGELPQGRDAASIQISGHSIPSDRPDGSQTATSLIGEVGQGGCVAIVPIDGDDTALSGAMAQTFPW